MSNNQINLNDTFLLYDLAKKNYFEYDNLNEKLVIEDMKRIFVFNKILIYFMLKQ
jgi:hypothetical protein